MPLQRGSPQHLLFGFSFLGFGACVVLAAAHVWDPLGWGPDSFWIRVWWFLEGTISAGMGFALLAMGVATGRFPALWRTADLVYSGLGVTRIGYFALIILGGVLALVYWILIPGGAVLGATIVSDTAYARTVSFVTYAVGLFVAAYAAPWVLYAPAILLLRFISGSRGIDEVTGWVITFASRFDLRQVAYLFGTIGIVVSMTVSTAPDPKPDWWSGLMPVAAQAFLLFMAVDQFFATFYQEAVLDRLRAAHFRALEGAAAHATGRRGRR